MGFGGWGGLSKLIAAKKRYVCLIIHVAGWTLSYAAKQHIGGGYYGKEPNEIKSSAGTSYKRGEEHEMS